MSSEGRGHPSSRGEMIKVTLSELARGEYSRVPVNSLLEGAGQEPRGEKSDFDEDGK